MAIGYPLSGVECPLTPWAQVGTRWHRVEELFTDTRILRSGRRRSTSWSTHTESQNDSHPMNDSVSWYNFAGVHIYRVEHRGGPRAIWFGQFSLSPLSRDRLVDGSWNPVFDIGAAWLPRRCASQGGPWRDCRGATSTRWNGASATHEGRAGHNPI